MPRYEWAKSHQSAKNLYGQHYWFHLGAKLCCNKVTGRIIFKGRGRKDLVRMGGEHMAQTKQTEIEYN